MSAAPFLPSRSQHYILAAVFVLAGVCSSFAQDPPAPADPRSQYPALLASAIVEFAVGDIDYAFSDRQLAPGRTAQGLDIPHLGARLSAGSRLNDRFSAQMLYLRPARWVQYHGVDGGTESHSVWMNVFGGSVATRLPLGSTFSIQGELGAALVTRHGFELGSEPGVNDAVFVSPLVGGGLEYHVSDTWGVKLSATYIAGRASVAQPHTTFLSTGLTYRAHSSQTPVDTRGRNGRPLFPARLLQIGYATDGLGRGVNALVSPVFWEGRVHVARRFSIDSQQNVFHTAKVFSIDVGASLAYNTSQGHRDDFVTVAVYPLFRWTVVRLAPADVYVTYSVLGPTYISKFIIDGENTGKRFTFQDLFGIGFYAGRSRRLNFEVRIGHFSNANLAPRNAGIEIPLGVLLGYAF